MPEEVTINTLARMVQNGFEEIRTQLHAVELGTTKRFSGIDRKLSGIDKRTSGTENRLSSIEKQVAGVESRFSGVGERLSGIEKRLLGVEDRLFHHDARFDKQDAQLEKIYDEILQLKKGWISHEIDIKSLGKRIEQELESKNSTI